MTRLLNLLEASARTDNFPLFPDQFHCLSLIGNLRITKFRGVMFQLHLEKCIKNCTFLCKLVSRSYEITGSSQKFQVCPAEKPHGQPEQIYTWFHRVPLAIEAMICILENFRLHPLLLYDSLSGSFSNLTLLRAANSKKRTISQIHENVRTLCRSL